ncbi:unnamed protein product [Sphagnum compactum]
MTEVQQNSEFPPSFPAADSGSSGDDAVSFPDINPHIDVEKEIANFVSELDAVEGREEMLFTPTMMMVEKAGSSATSNDGGDDGQDLKDVLESTSETTSRDFWGGGGGGGDAATTPNSPNKFDNVSSLKMTYYAFKEATGQKSGIPVSLLAAHLERKESRYPSFLGSRSSVNMGDGSSAGTFRTLQRSPIRRMSEETYPALTPQVLDVISSLEEYKKKCENDGNYMEARAAAQRLNGVKVLEDNKRKTNMIQRHHKDQETAENAYKSETAERNRLWDEKLHEFHKGVVEHAAKLKRQQIGSLQAFRQRMAAKTPVKPQWSRELLKHRKVQAFLGKQGKYLEANEVKRIADRMEHMELEATLAAYAAEVAIKEQALRAKQQNEMEVLLQRAAQGRDDLRKTRALDLERCTQRHKNILRELKTLQRQENLRFDAILGKRVSEFKKSGGSFQLLSQTLNGLCLPGNPECSVGDESSTYGSNSVLSG